MSNAGINAEQYTFVVKYPRKAAARLAELEAERDRLKHAICVYARKRWVEDYKTDEEAIAKFLKLAWNLGGRMDKE